MALYAVHFGWINDYAAKAPVGIWGESGIYYPAELRSHHKSVAKAAAEFAQISWAHWVYKRTQYGTSAGATWRAFESDESIEKAFAVVQAKFISAAQIVQNFLIQSGESTAGDEPAQRFVLAQSWWVGAELVRRHPELILHEMHPGGGQYDVLAAFTLPHDGALVHIMLNRAGTIQVHISETPNSEPAITVIGTWGVALCAVNPHEIVKRIEDVAQLARPRKAPKSTPRALAYRFIAALLNSTVNDRHVWDARNDFIDSSGDDWGPGDTEVHGFTDGFLEVREDFPTTPKIGLWQEPNSHFWAILRDQIPVAIVSIEGRVYSNGGRHDLAEAYAANGRRMLPLVANILGDLLT
jgi:hypothetical protein